MSQTIATGNTPVWAVARSDSARIYVLNSGSGTVSTIDTTTDTLLSSVPVGAGANYMAYDSKLNRLYVTNPTANTVTALNVSADPPTVLFATPVAAGPITVAVLPDGSRAYAVSSSKIPPCTSDPGGHAGLYQFRRSPSSTPATAASGRRFRSSPPSASRRPRKAAPIPTYTYTLISGPALRPGMEMVVIGHGRRGEQRNIHAGSGKRWNLYGRQLHRDHGERSELGPEPSWSRSQPRTRRVATSWPGRSRAACSAACASVFPPPLRPTVRR